MAGIRLATALSAALGSIALAEAPRPVASQPGASPSPQFLALDESQATLKLVQVVFSCPAGPQL
ncbi:hypothetical protein HaLaN_29906 [Haematococcus lacustris]|uniref:Uncharacterized protein n=1 Tax=Haematococcus lacustris TaxID=44745 RepID=A0A6A0AE49_HAELA|nr:hypothetical protein HaLaN_29906 [Haematococcus lacustris]